MPKFLVISYDDDQQQTFFDRIVAKNDDAAEVAIGLIREHAIPCTALTVDELRQMADEMDELPEPVIKEEIRRLNQAYKEEERG